MHPKTKLEVGGRVKGYMTSATRTASAYLHHKGHGWRLMYFLHHPPNLLDHEEERHRLLISHLAKARNHPPRADQYMAGHHRLQVDQRKAILRLVEDLQQKEGCCGNGKCACL